ncbi:MAG: hypothetical protein H7Y11_01545 [Armatimonadetes bacterium]|nr:hypothetical protein [Anaerolineae bacterium]
MLNMHRFYRISQAGSAEAMASAWVAPLRWLLRGMLMAFGIYVISQVFGPLFSPRISFGTPFTPLMLVAVLGVLGMVYLDHLALQAGDALKTLAEIDKLKYGQAQTLLRAWQFTWMLIGWRAVVILLAALNLYQVAELRGVYRYVLYFNPTQALFWLPAMLMFAVYYCAEPVWRLNMAARFGTAYDPTHYGDWRLVHGIGAVGFYLLVMLTIPQVAQWQDERIAGQAILAISYGDVTAFLDREARFFVASFEALSVVYFVWGVTSVLLLGGGWRYYRVTTHRYRQIQGSAAVIAPTISWLHQLLPWLAIVSTLRAGNPIVNFEVQKVEQGRAVDAFYSWSYGILWKCLIIIVVCMTPIALLINAVQQQTSNYGYTYYYWDSGLVWFMLLTGGLSILGTILMEFASIASGLSLKGHHPSYNTPPSLTNQPEADLAAARHLTAQLRGWRFVIGVFALRLVSAAAALLMIFTTFIQLLLYGGPLWWLLSWLWLGVIGGVWLLEPFWRYHAMTAVSAGLALGHDLTINLLLCFGAGIGVWLLQAGIGAFYYSMLPWIGEPTFLYSGRDYNSTFLFKATLLLLLIAVTLYGFYALLTRLSLRYAARRAFEE